MDLKRSMSRNGQSGSGPGPIAPDGSPVHLYAMLEPKDEPAIIHAAIPAGARILELGCGTGRVTNALAALGHKIVAVDESREMLDAFRIDRELSVIRVQSMIEDLRLDKKFDVVLFASQLVNSIDAPARKGMLDTCRRHVSDEGVVIIQRHDVSFLTEPIDRRRGNTRFVVRAIEHHDRDVVSGVLEYHIDESVWSQTIWVQNLNDNELRGCLYESSLRLDAFLTEDRTWLRAIPA